MSAERPLRICFAMLYYAPGENFADPARYLSRTPIHRALPQELAARGHQVDLVHFAPRDVEYVEGGVRYHFVAAPRLVRGLSRAAGRISRRDPVYYEPALRAIKLIERLRPDVVHFHGLTLNLNLFLTLMSRQLSRQRPPVVLHYHGGYPSRAVMSRWVQRFNLEGAAHCCFTTREHAAPFVEAAMLTCSERVVELIETSSDFQMGDRRVARRTTGMHGCPVFLWVGRLHPIKGPLTALRGFERIQAAWPDARLYLHYLTDDCLPEMRAFVAARPHLASHVHFRGRANFDQMEQIYNSADFLLQASRREFSGCAVLEAMACGVIPVVTDIPSFRAMTDNGRVGVLFPIDDDAELARRVLAIPPEEVPHRSTQVREHFGRALSFAAMAQRLEAIYLDLGQERAKGGR